MPAYGVYQSGPYVDSSKNLRVVFPGENYTLLDGTEADEELASVAIVRGPSAGQSQVYSTFHAVGLGAAETCDVQASNTDVDGDYYTIATMTSELASPAGIPNFTDSGSPLFYRVLKSGGTCIVKVQR